MVRVVAAVLSLSVALASPVAAQPTSCPALMSFGIHDDFNTLSTKSYFRAVTRWMCHQSFKSYADAERESTDIGFGIDIFDFDFGGVKARDHWEQWSDAMCKASFDQVQNDERYTASLRRISPALTKLVETCIKSQTQGVIYGWLDTSQNRKNITFHAKYRPAGDGDSARITAPLSFIPPAARAGCDTASLKLFDAGQALESAERAVSCQIDPDQTITVTLNTNRGPASVTLDPVESTKLAAAPTLSVTATPPGVQQGQSTKLSWKATNVAKVTVSGVSGEFKADDSTTLTPTSTTTYTVTASNAAGQSVVNTITILVTTAPPTATLSVQPPTIVAGQSATLSWVTKSATAITIDQGIGPVGGATGSINVSPNTRTVYKLVAQGPGGPPVQQEVTLEVNPKIRLFENVDRGGQSFDVNQNTNVSGPLKGAASSIQLFTSEWAMFTCQRPFVTYFLFVKGPRTVDNLHGINNPHGAHFGDCIVSVNFAGAPICDPADACTTLQ